MGALLIYVFTERKYVDADVSEYVQNNISFRKFVVPEV